MFSNVPHQGLQKMTEKKAVLSIQLLLSNICPFSCWTGIYGTDTDVEFATAEELWTCAMMVKQTLEPVVKIWLCGAELEHG